MHHPTDRITHTTAFVTPVVEHWLEREIAQWVHPTCEYRVRVVSVHRPTMPRPRALKFRGRQNLNKFFFIYEKYYWPRGAKYKCASLYRERNVLFNDALNTFYLRLYGVRHMVKDHSDSKKGNPLSPHRLLLSINSKGSFICTIPQTG